MRKRTGWLGLLAAMLFVGISGGVVTVAAETPGDDMVTGAATVPGEGTVTNAATVPGNDTVTGTVSLQKAGVVAETAGVQREAVVKAVRITKGYALSAKKIRLGWSKVQDADGYLVYRKNGGSWKLVADTGRTTWVDAGPKNGTVFRYRVRAYRIINGEKKYGRFLNTYKVTIKKPKVQGHYHGSSPYGEQLGRRQLKQVRRAVQSFVDNYITSGMSDYKKIRTAYDYIRRTCRYGSFDRAATAWGALVNGKALCSGYSRGIKALCDAMGIPSRCVHANSFSRNPKHMWNEVQIDGKWYVLDAQGGFFLYSAQRFHREYGMRWDGDDVTECRTQHPRATSDQEKW